jgi:hypothetical protein
VRVQIFGGGRDSGSREFIGKLKAQCRELGAPVEVTGNSNKAPGNPGASVAVVFAGRSKVWTAQEERDLDRFVRKGAGVLPVIDDADAARYLPPVLRPINAFKKSDYGDGWAQGLADELLGIAWQRRRMRKVFISYRRVDSAPVANQLFDRFTGLGYETFLDDASIDRGVDFQRELKWWLNDADLLIVLFSPNFPRSKWCMEEIAFAQARGIGILAVEWPKQPIGKRSSVQSSGVRGFSELGVLDGTTSDQRIQLASSDFSRAATTPGRDRSFDRRELTEAGRERIVAACTRQRTIAIRQRLDNLIPLAQELLPARGKVRHGARLGDLKFTDHSGQRHFVRVLPFRPRPETVHEAFADAAGHQIAGCLYAECDLADLRGVALRWLANTTRTTPRPPSESRVWAYCADVLL